MGLERILKSMPTANSPGYAERAGELPVTVLRSKIKELRIFSNNLRRTGITGEILGNGLLEICYTMVILANTYGHYQ